MNQNYISEMQKKKFSKLNFPRENLLKTNLKVTLKKVTITANIQQHKIKIRALEFFVIAGRNVTTSTSVQKLFKASVALFLIALMPLLSRRLLGLFSLFLAFAACATNVTPVRRVAQSRTFRRVTGDLNLVMTRSSKCTHM